jgi:hypothetical protein
MSNGNSTLSNWQEYETCLAWATNTQNKIQDEGQWWIHGESMYEAALVSKMDEGAINK